MSITCISNILSVLLRQPVDEVKKIYLLNRPNAQSTMAQRHAESFAERGLDFHALQAAVETGRVVYLEMDVKKERLGIDDGTYSKV